jgi:hypothetical protein
MLVLEHMRQLVESCYPADRTERIALWSDVKPVKYGTTVQWLASGEYTLAIYQVPDEAAYHVVLRVECYTVDLTSGSTDYGLFEPPPPGQAFWRYVPFGSGATYNETDTNAPVQRLLDADEMLFFKGGYNLSLIGNFAVSPDGNTREVRTLVYGYNVGAAIADLLGRGEVEIPSQ